MSDWQIIEGDCLAVMRGMADGSVDAVVTDPPYASGGLHIAAKGSAPGEKYAFGGNTGHVSKEYPSFEGDNCDQWSWMLNMRAWLIEAYAKTKDGGHLYVFSDWRQLAATIEAVQMGQWRYLGMLVWDKGGFCRASYPGLWRQSSEFVIWAAKGKPHTNGITPVGALHEERIISSGKEHPTQKPIGLLTKIVETATPPGGMVVDPFCGSGSTGVACVASGRAFVGIEQSAKYCAIARARIAAQPAPLIVMEREENTDAAAQPRLELMA